MKKEVSQKQNSQLQPKDIKNIEQYLSPQLQP